MQTPPISEQWTVLNTLQWTSGYFQSRDIDSPRSCAEILLAHALNLRRIDLYLQHDKPLKPDELALYRALVTRRAQREPVAYITGEKEFWSLPLSVTQDTLIPRPETEKLVETALRLIPEDPCKSDDAAGSESSENQPLRILDLGTGTGAIILALASERPGHLYFASDWSHSALSVARKNARRHRLSDQVHFFCGNGFEPLLIKSAHFDVIVSNPPYIKTNDIDGLQPEISYYEPKTALDGGPDGLRMIQYIMQAARGVLSKNGCLLLEIGHDQADGVRTLARAANFYQDIEIIPDDGGHDRVALMKSLA